AARTACPARRRQYRTFAVFALPDRHHSRRQCCAALCRHARRRRPPTGRVASSLPSIGTRAESSTVARKIWAWSDLLKHVGFIFQAIETAIQDKCGYENRDEQGTRKAIAIHVWPRSQRHPREDPVQYREECT